MPIQITIDIGDRGQEAYEAQWDALFDIDKAGEDNVTLTAGTQSITVAVKGANFYIEDPRVAVNYAEDHVKDDTSFSAYAIETAIKKVRSEAADGDIACYRAQVVFAICEAARFKPFRTLFYRELNGLSNPARLWHIRDILTSWSDALDAVHLSVRDRAPLSRTQLRQAGDALAAGGNNTFRQACSRLTQLLRKEPIPES